MAVAQNCCLPGYSYDTGTQKCLNIGDPSLPPAEPVPCACCPSGYVYVTDTGEYLTQDLYYTPITNGNKVPFYDTCAQIVNSGYAIASGLDPQYCPCCLPNYTYSSQFGLCINNANHKDMRDPIPCIPCVCTVPAPYNFSCPTCGTASPIGPVNFSFDFTTRQCTSCAVQNGNVPPGCFVIFIPTTFADPITSNFKLKNLNYI